MTDLTREREDSIVKAAFEAAAQECDALYGEGDSAHDAAAAIRALTPESAILGAQIAELEARREEAKWWQRFISPAHYDYCDFGSTDGPRGDFCTCGLAKRQESTSRRIPDLDSQLSALKAEREGVAKK